MAFKLDSPPNSGVRHVFHVSCLKPKLGQTIIPISTLPLVDTQGHLTLEPKAILQYRPSQLRGHKQDREVLVHWEGFSPDDATWELLHKLQNQYPYLVGKVL